MYYLLFLLSLVSLELGLSHEIGWEERLRNDLFLCRVGRKTLTQLINPRLRFTGLMFPVCR